MSFPRRQESIRTAFLLSQGGEFAFVLLSLANELKVGPRDDTLLLPLMPSNHDVAGTCKCCKKGTFCTGI